MITRDTINNLYKTGHTTISKHIDENAFHSDCIQLYNITFNKEHLTIHHCHHDSPLRVIPLSNIIGVEELSSHTAIILRNSIIFLNKYIHDIKVHIRIVKPSIWERIRFFFSGL